MAIRKPPNSEKAASQYHSHFGGQDLFLAAAAKECGMP